MSDAPLPGPLDDFLLNPPAGADRPERRQALLQQTTGTIRRRRRVRQWRRFAMSAAVVMLCAGIVIAIVRTVDLLREPGDVMAVQHPGPPEHNAPPAPKAEGPPAGNGQPAAVALEWQAFDAPRTQQTALYVQAGDRYVEDQQDLGSAVRCYGQALRAAPAVAVEADDNWLMIAMKLDEIERRKEK